MEYKCPNCGKSFSTNGKLKRHIERMAGKSNHPAASAPPTPETPPSSPPVTPPPGGKPPERLEAQAPAPKQRYHCNNCGGDVKKGENPCPHCGDTLEWEALENASN